MVVPTVILKVFYCSVNVSVLLNELLLAPPLPATTLNHRVAAHVYRYCMEQSVSLNSVKDYSNIQLLTDYHLVMQREVTHIS